MSATSTLAPARSPTAASSRPLLQQLSHTATQTNDMEAVRKFYEDFLGLPMVTTLVADFDAVTNDKSNYVHCFFQLADGSCIAFFQFEEGYRDEVFPHTNDPYERHLALRVDERHTVDEFSARAKDLGVEGFVIDHDDFYSLYLIDPNGDPIEVTWHKPSLEHVLDAPKAHKTLDEWLANARKSAK